MADGSVKIDVGLNIGKAERDLAKLKEKIARAEDQLNANADKKSQLETKLENAGKAADAARERVKKLQEEYDNSRGSERAKIKVDLGQAKQTYKDNAGDAERLGREYQKVSEDIDSGTQNLAKMKDQAGQLVQQIESARPGETLAAGIETAQKKIRKFIKYAFGIRSVYILFQRLKGYIKDSVKELAEHDSELKKTLDTMEATKKATKLAWGSAFAGIYTAILPVVQKIANWMLEAANAAAKFVAIISGKDTYKRAVVDTTEISENLEDVEESAKEAKKQIMGFDELNILSGDAGGSGSGKSAKDKLDGVNLVEEKIDKFDGSFLTDLAFTVKDVFFDWSDLTPEQIAEKALAGLIGLGGAIIGGMIGGVPGAIIGLIAGLTLGVILDSTIFNADGKLSQDELIKTLIDAAGFVAGAAIGFALGGPLGALIGATLGLALAVDLTKTSFSTTGEFDGKKLWDRIVEIFFGDFKKRVEEWKKVFGNDGAGIAMALIAGFYEGLWKKAVSMYEAVKTIFEAVVKTVKYVLGIHSPSTVFEEIGENLVAGFLNGVKDKWEDVKQYFRGAIDKIKGMMNFTWSFPRPKLPHFNVSWRQIGKWMSIPSVSVDWYARGGVFDFPQLIGVGENGKEAVVPLERNTEWMRVVADGLMERIERSRFADKLAAAFASTPRPAMASGSVVPPNAVSNRTTDISSAVSKAITDALGIALNQTTGRFDDNQPINVYIGDEKLDSFIVKRNKRNTLLSGGR